MTREREVEDVGQIRILQLVLATTQCLLHRGRRGVFILLGVSTLRITWDKTKHLRKWFRGSGRGRRFK